MDRPYVPPSGHGRVLAPEYVIEYTLIWGTARYFGNDEMVALLEPLTPTA